ncbi:MAG: hypothetical protein IT544_00350 [Rhodobacteraceae bacterium]|nr:hypothetical protein [Paracoccaceae bacterium]
MEKVTTTPKAAAITEEHKRNLGTTAIEPLEKKMKNHYFSTDTQFCTPVHPQQRNRFSLAKKTGMAATVAKTRIRLSEFKQEFADHSTER